MTGLFLFSLCHTNPAQPCRAPGVPSFPVMAILNMEANGAKISWASQPVTQCISNMSLLLYATKRTMVVHYTALTWQQIIEQKPIKWPLSVITHITHRNHQKVQGEVRSPVKLCDPLRRKPSETLVTCWWDEIIWSAEGHQLLVWHSLTSLELENVYYYFFY